MDKGLKQMDEGKMYACMARYIFCMCILLYYHRCLVLGSIQMEATTNKEAFDEQKALQQALFLVELLKSEYARVLRENKEKQSNRLLWEEGSITCATTKKEKIEGAPATPQVHQWPRRIQAIFPALRNWRRRIPKIDSNLYYDIPVQRNDHNEGYEDKENAGEWRRFQYEDAFGPQPGGTNISRTTNSASPFSITHITTHLSAATTSIASTENDNLLTAPSSSSAVSTPKTKPSEITASVTASTIKDTITTPLTTLSHTTGRIILLFSKKNTSPTSNVLNSNEGGKLQSKAVNLGHMKLSNGTPRDSELALSQAAAELEKELGPNFGNWKKRNSRKIPKIWQATTRVHLARSTRYPIPLPENHAFCYTNPYSALCRTYI